MRADQNQARIVDSLRRAGCTVMITSQVGGGFPDLVVGIFGKNYLMEIKNPETYGKLSTEQLLFRDRWKGRVDVVESDIDALKIIGCQF